VQRTSIAAWNTFDVEYFKADMLELKLQTRRQLLFVTGQANQGHDTVETIQRNIDSLFEPYASPP
jgi:hypothetical protein